MNKLVGKILTGWTRIAAGSCLALVSLASAQTQPIAARQDQSGAPQQNAVQKGPAMTKHASGTFDVKVTPQRPDNKEAETSKIGRMSLDKQFHGDLEVTSQGEMLAAMSEVKGSAGYVAMERVNGKLQGRSGTFVLQHTGTMTRGVPQLSVTVVPDSGTGELMGIAGAMTIKIDEGKHSYEFDYSLPDTH